MKRKHGIGGLDMPVTLRLRYRSAHTVPKRRPSAARQATRPPVFGV